MTTDKAQSYRIEYQPQLIEEAVLLAMRGHADERLFRQQRNQIYERIDSEEREAAFQRLHRNWFDILKMNRPLSDCLSLWPILHEATQHCLVMKARAPKEMGAELYRTSETLTHDECHSLTILLQVTPALLTLPEALLAFLRHELLHVVDMLDPRFAYAPNFPKSDAGPAYDHLLQNRYAVLWDLIIDGRLHQRGWLPPAARERHFAAFKRAFQGAEENLARMFAHFFDHNSHTHHELVAFAQYPEQWLTMKGPEVSRKGRCAICHFPMFQLLDPQTLTAEVAAEIQKQNPSWNLTQFICRQCADLYAARVS